jgi:PTS system fructose-specific IIC component
MITINNIIVLDQKINSKNELFEIIGKKAVELKIADDSKKVVKGLQDREALGSTGFQDGFGIPHCRIKEIKIPSVIFIKAKTPIE